jgi:hypothetical protein
MPRDDWSKVFDPTSNFALHPAAALPARNVPPQTGRCLPGSTGRSPAMMLEALRLFNTLLGMLGGLRQPLANLVVEPLVTVGLLLALYAGWHVRDEGDLAAGLHVAFVDTRANREAERQALIGALMQAELHQYATSSRMIDQMLATVISHAAGVARVRLAVIHNGVSGLTGVSMLRYDVINAVAPPGRAAGDLIVNQPLSTWSDVLPALLTGKCQVVAAADVQNFALRTRMQTLGANTNLTCPVIDIEGKLLGAIFVDWDGGDRPPDGAQLQALIEFDERIGAQVASVLNLRRFDPPPGE